MICTALSICPSISGSNRLQPYRRVVTLVKPSNILAAAKTAKPSKPKSKGKSTKNKRINSFRFKKDFLQLDATPESTWVPFSSPVDKSSDEIQREILRSNNKPNIKSWRGCKHALYEFIDNYDGKVQDQYTSIWYDFTKSETDNHAPLSVEHIVPRSVVQKFSEIVQDLHNLIPVESNLNSRRQSYPFGPGNCANDASCLENKKMLIRDEIKGFIARSVIYVFVMYEMKLKDRMKLDVDAVGKMEMLVDWCLTFQPTDYELNRNARIEKSQGNRNPFIDDTELCKLALSIK